MLEMCIVMDEKSIIGSLNKPLLYNGSDIFHIIKIMIVFSYCLCIWHRPPWWTEQHYLNFPR